MDKRKLHLQANRIETVLIKHRAPARITGGRVTPRLIQFNLQVDPAVKVSSVQALSEEIAMAVGARSARVTRSQGLLSIQIPRSDPVDVRFLPLARRLANDSQLNRAMQIPGTALLGLDTDGIPLLVRLASPDVTHILIAGTTGSGKTEVMRTLLASLIYFQRPREIQLVLIDPKGSAFRMFEGLPHLLFSPIKTVQEALERLRWLTAEMERRQQQGTARPRLVLVLDELADLLQQGGGEMQAYLTRLAQRGRSAGISLVACTQKPSASSVGSLTRANFPVRLVGRVTSADEARIAAGLAASGAEKLAGHGDFVLVAAGELVRFQAAHLPAGEYEEFRAHLALNAGRNARASRDRSLISRLRRQGG
ncbi:MAG: DNA translocase FtsK [Rudaea sp.]